MGVPIKASAPVSRKTMKNLQSTFAANDKSRPIYKERITQVIDSFFRANDRHTRANFCDYLNFHGINAVFRESKNGRVYGITFIDNRKSVVINGSDLGKQYSGQALVKRFKVPPVIGSAAGEKERQERFEHEIKRPQREQNDPSEANWMQNISQPLLDLMKAEKIYAEPENPMFKRRKKKKRGLPR